jgi:hypothetical protein
VNIAIVTNSFPTNSETFIINKVLALANAGYKITVIRLAASGSKELMHLYNFKANNNIVIKDALVPTTMSELIKFASAHPFMFISSFCFNKSMMYKKLRKNILLKQFNQ